MLTDRSYYKSTVDLLTQSINVIDAIEESEKLNLENIALLGYTYDQSDLLKFENIFHASGVQTVVGPNGEYKLESLPDTVRIKFLATEDGNCRLTQLKVAVTAPGSSASKQLGVTLFAFSNITFGTELCENQFVMQASLEELYWAHKKSPLSVYYIGHSRPHHFNLPLIFAGMDAMGVSRPLSPRAIPSTSLIQQRLAESQSVLSDMNEEKYSSEESEFQRDPVFHPAIDSDRDVLPVAPTFQAEVVPESEPAATARTARRSTSYHTAYLHSRPHRFARDPIRVSHRSRPYDENNPYLDEEKSSFCLNQ
jgi:hypothetical protein